MGEALLSALVWLPLTTSAGVADAGPGEGNTDTSGGVALAVQSELVTGAVRAVGAADATKAKVSVRAASGDVHEWHMLRLLPPPQPRPLPVLHHASGAGGGAGASSGKQRHGDTRTVHHSSGQPPSHGGWLASELLVGSWPRSWCKTTTPSYHYFMSHMPWISSTS